MMEPYYCVCNNNNNNKSKTEKPCRAMQRSGFELCLSTECYRGRGRRYSMHRRIDTKKGRRSDGWIGYERKRRERKTAMDEWNGWVR